MKLEPGEGDNVVFSASTIPNPINLANRDLLDRRLKERGARIYNNVHVSGHAGPEDIENYKNATTTTFNTCTR